MHQLIEILSTAPTHNSESPGHFVKTLKIYYYRYIDLNLVDELFPFVQVISNGGYIGPFRKIIYEFLKRGRFRNLKKTPFTTLDEDHLELLLDRKEDIKELELRNMRYDSLVDKLLEIMPLIHFEILEMDFFHLDDDAVETSLETLLSKAPSTLKSIDFEFRIPSKIKFNTLSSNSSNIQPLPALREVRIANYELSFLGEEDYLYIMKKFPKVELLEFKFDWETQLKVLDIIDYTAPAVESSFQFLQYLFNIRGSSCSPAIITNQSTAEVVKTFFDYVLSQRLSSATLSNVEIHLNLNLRGSKAQPGYADDKDCTACIIPKNEYRDTKKVCTVEVGYETKSDSNHQLYLELFQTIGNTDIECLRIEDSSWIYRSQGKVYIPLEAILENLTNVKKIIICTIYNLTLPEELSRFEERPKSNLERLELYGCELKQNMFPYISALCPNLKVLKIGICRFTCPPRTDGLPNLFRHVHINMPYTCLEELYFSISFGDNDMYEYHSYEKAVIRSGSARGETKYFEITFAGWIDEESFRRTETRQCAVANYEKGLEDEFCLVFDIYCESITKFFTETKPQ